MSETKPLYIKEFGLEDWDLVKEIQKERGCSIADAVRWAVKKATGRA